MEYSQKDVLVNSSLGADVVSVGMLLEDTRTFAIQAVWSGTPTGTLRLQASCDRGTEGNVDNVVNWSNIASTDVALAGAAGGQLWNIDGAGYRWVRVQYVRTSGTGTLNARISVKP